MVRVPRLPLSMTAVDSNMPSSISTADMTCVRPLWFSCSVFYAITRQNPGNPDGHRSKRPDQPIRAGCPTATTEDRPFEDGSGATRWNGARGCARTAPDVRAFPAQNTFMLHRGNRRIARWDCLAHVLDAHRELAFVVGVAHSGGALIDVRHVL